MPTATLSLECSKKIRELLGDMYETERYRTLDTGYVHRLVPSCRVGVDCIPSPSFSETIRLLPRIAEKKGWRDYVNRSEESGHGMWDTLEDMTCFFVEAPTEEEGMAKVREYL